MCRVLCRSTDWMFPSLSQVSFSGLVPNGQFWNVHGKNDILRLFRWSYGGQSLKLCQECIANNIAVSNLAPLFSFLQFLSIECLQIKMFNHSVYVLWQFWKFRHHLSMFCHQAMRLGVRYIVDGTTSNEFVFSVVMLPPCILHSMVVQQETARMSKLTVCILGCVKAEKLKTFQQLPNFLPLQSFIFAGTKYCWFQATLKDLKTSYLDFTLT